MKYSISVLSGGRCAERDGGGRGGADHAGEDDGGGSRVRAGQHGDGRGGQDGALRRAGGVVAGVDQPHRGEVAGRRNRDRGVGAQGGDVGRADGVFDDDFEARSDGGRGGEHQVVPIPPGDGLPVRPQPDVRGYGEVDPPGGEDDEQPARRGGKQRAQGVVLVDAGFHRHGRGGDRLAQHDDREQAVAFGDVARVPGGLVVAFGDERDRQL